MIEPETMGGAVTLAAVLRRFRRGGELRVLVCLLASMAAIALAGGTAIGVACLIGLMRPGWGNVVGEVRQRDIVIAASIAGGVWLVALFWLWRPAVRLHLHSRGDDGGTALWGRPLIATAFIGGALMVAFFLVDLWRLDGRAWVRIALGLLAAGAALVFWLPTVFRIEQGRPVTGRGGAVNVRCTQCSYSMVGLRETTCPECGAAYTIDTLIAAQGYAGTASAPPPSPDSPPPG